MLNLYLLLRKINLINSIEKNLISAVFPCRIPYCWSPSNTMPAIVKNYAIRFTESPSFNGIRLCCRDFVGFFIENHGFVQQSIVFIVVFCVNPNDSSVKFVVLRRYSDQTKKTDSLIDTRDQFEIMGNHEKSRGSTENHPQGMY